MAAMSQRVKPKQVQRYVRHPPGALAKLAARDAECETWQHVRAVQNLRRLNRMLEQVCARIGYQRSVMQATIARRRAAILERNVRVARIAAKHRVRVERFVAWRRRW